MESLLSRCWESRFPIFDTTSTGEESIENNAETLTSPSNTTNAAAEMCLLFLYPPKSRWKNHRCVPLASGSARL